MSESTSAHGTTLDYRGPGIRRASSLARIGGALGVAGTLIGFAIFMGACAGFGAAFALSPIPLILGVVGLALTIVGGFFSEDVGLEDPQVVACYAINVAVIAGAMLELAMWKGWPIFHM
ncbi:MAG: hypothetical protein WBD40_15770 [Tepidisphaeraceae bacterium]